jgi:hypothetical protein
MVSLSSMISLLSFCLDDLSVADRGVLKHPTTTVLESICALNSFSVYLMKMCSLILGAYRLIIIISFWCIPFSRMKRLLSRLTNVSLKSTFSDISIATPGCFWGPLTWWIFQPFTLSQFLFLSMGWVSCKEQIVSTSILIQFANGVFRWDCWVP